MTKNSQYWHILVMRIGSVESSFHLSTVPAMMKHPAERTDNSLRIYFVSIFIYAILKYNCKIT